jgi:hypothetical protein
MVWGSIGYIIIGSIFLGLVIENNQTATSWSRALLYLSMALFWPITIFFACGMMLAYKIRGVK